MPSAATTLEEQCPTVVEEGSAGLRIIGLSTLPASVRANLTIDLLEDPQLTPENMKELQDKLKSSLI